MLNNLGYALGITGDSDSIGCLEQALSIRREIGDRIGEAQAANNLADAYRALGRRQEALELLHRALHLDREVGYRLGEGVVLVNLGDVLLGLDRADEAIDYLQQARRTFAEIDHADGTGYALYWLGQCYASLGRDAEALDCLRAGAGQSPGRGQPVPAGGHAEDPSAGSRPAAAWSPRRTSRGLRQRRSSTTSATALRRRRYAPNM